MLLRKEVIQVIDIFPHIPQIVENGVLIGAIIAVLWGGYELIVRKFMDGDGGGWE